MREIKFRAWHKDHKMMRMVVGLFWDAEQNERVELFDVHLSDENPMWCGLEDIEIMQYTGLKDKNGKEIYEGDIIEVQFSEYWGGDKIMSEIFYENGCFLFHRMPQHNDLLMGVRNTCLILGNIYENSELLE